MQDYTTNDSRDRSGKTRILLWGGYPPPYGGITVHIKRLRRLLQKEGFAVTVIDHLTKHKKKTDAGVYQLHSRHFLSLADFLLHTRAHKYDLAHIHVSSFGRFWWVGYGTLLMAKRSVLTMHAGGIISAGKIKKRFIESLLKRMDSVILVNNSQKTELESAGIHLNRYKVIPAFLPPENPPAHISLSKEIRRFTHNSKIVLVSGSPLLRVYDFVTVIKALARIPPKMFKVIFVFYRWGSRDNEAAYEQEIRTLISRAIKQDYLIYDDLQPELYSVLLKLSDVYVRSTIWDGDAVSVREALYFGKTVVASDSAQRPDGCLIFKTRDDRDLSAKLRTAKSHKRAKGTRQNANNADEIIEIYNTLLPTAPVYRTFPPDDTD